MAVLLCYWCSRGFISDLTNKCLLFERFSISSLSVWIYIYLLLRCWYNTCISIRVMNTLVHLRTVLSKVQVEMKVYAKNFT